jgi:hypothetical protein
MEFEFSRYESEQQRGIGDEKLRAFVGERLAALPDAEIQSLSADGRALYDRVLLRCEFANEAALERFGHFGTAQSIANTQAVDKEVIAAADAILDKTIPLDETLRRLDDAFDKRDKAMLDR